MSKLRCIAFVAAGHLLGCRSPEAQPTPTLSSPPDLGTSTHQAAAAPPSAAPAPPDKSGDREGLPGAEASAPNPAEASAAANHADIAKPADGAEVAKLQRCCVELENLGKKGGQEGSTFIALSSVCDEMAIALRNGKRPGIDSSNWDEIRSALDEKGIPPGCRTLMLSLEKR